MLRVSRTDPHGLERLGNLDLPELPGERLFPDVWVAKDSRGEDRAVGTKNFPAVGVVLPTLIAVLDSHCKGADRLRGTRRGRGKDIGGAC